MSAPAPLDVQEPMLPERFRVMRGSGWSVRFDARAATVTAILAALLAFSAIWSITIGDTDLSLGEVLAALVGQGSETTQQIVVEWRLPRMLLALLGGAALGMSGAIFQSMTRNPLGSPEILGFSSGAYTGALISMLLLGSSSAVTSLGALLGGLATALVVYLLAYQRGVHGMRLVIVGISVGAMLNALNSYLLITANLEEAVSAAAWGAGSLNNATWSGVGVILISLVLLAPLTVVMTRPMQMLEMGDDSASALGVRVERTRLTMLVLGVGYVAVITALAGPIAFVALAAPQLARRLTRAAGVTLMASAVMGGLLLVVSDVLARVLVAPAQLPVGVITSCLGGGYLLWLLVDQARKS